MQTNRWWWLIGTVLGVFGGVWFAGQALAAVTVTNTYRVTGTADSTTVGCSLATGTTYDCPTLRVAVQAANSHPGSTIELVDGRTYTLTIPAAGANDAATGDLNVTADVTFGYSRTVRCNTNCGATIVGGPGFADRLLSLENGARVSATQWTLRGGHGQSTHAYGGAVFLAANTAFTLTYSTVQSNSSSFQGGAFWVDDQASLALIAVQVLSNSIVGALGLSAGGGAIYINQDGTVNVTGGVLRGNGPSGGSSGLGGGVFCAGTGLGGRLVLSDTVVESNTATNYGGGLYLHSCLGSLTGGRVTSNTVAGGAGGGLAAQGAIPAAFGGLILTGVAVDGNEAGSGGGLYLEPATDGSEMAVTIVGGSISTNTAQSHGGGLDLEAQNCNLTVCTALLTLTTTQVLGNAALQGTGGGLYLSHSTPGGLVMVNQVTLAHNQAVHALNGKGGGLHLTSGGMSAAGTTVDGNQAGVTGGGLCNQGILTFTGGVVSNNVVTGTTGGRATGGAGIANEGVLQMSTVSVTLNSSTAGGGAGILNAAPAVLTMVGGAVVSNVTAADVGGGLLNLGAAYLTGASLAYNQAQTVNGTGAAVYNAGAMTVAGGAWSQNQSGGRGGAGYNDITGTLRATGLVIDHNLAAGGHGGGLFNAGTAVLTSGQVLSNVVAGSSLAGGVANWGGGAYLTLVGGAVEYNHASLGGGVANYDGVVTITTGLLAHNVAANAGGAVASLASAGGNPGYVVIDRSTIWDNQVTGGAGWAGGVYNNHVLTMTNSTLVGNRTPDNGGGVYQIVSFDPSPVAYLSNVTIAANEADSDHNGSGTGGGVFVAQGTVVVRNSVIAGNSDALNGLGPDCSGTLTSDRFNLLQDSTGCTVTGNALGNLYGQDPLLGALQDNGGPTWTLALLPGSPAIDHGNPLPPGTGSSTCQVWDQRGVGRPVGSACDMGAYEAGGSLFHLYLPLVAR